MNIDKAFGSTRLSFTTTRPKQWRFSFTFDLFLKGNEFSPSLGISGMVPYFAFYFNLYTIRG